MKKATEERCDICGSTAVVLLDGIVGASLCADPACCDAAWERAEFPNRAGATEALGRVVANILAVPDDRLTILANKETSRGKFAAAAVHAALQHYGIAHGAVIVLGASKSQIADQCDLIIRDAGRTEVEPGTITAGIRRDG